MKEILKKILALITHRMVVLLLLIIFAFSILGARLFQMQIINGKRFDQEFELKVLREVAIDGQRGNIYDRNGVPLTENQISYSVTYDTGVYTKDLLQDLLTFSQILIRNGDRLNIDFPIYLDENGEFSYNPEFSETRIVRFQRDLEFEKEHISATEAIAVLRERWFKKTFKDPEEYLKRFQAMTKAEELSVISLRYTIWANGFYKFIPEKIARNITMDTMAELQENREKLPGFQIVEDYNRVYHYPEYFSHIIGYIGSITEETFQEYESYGYSREDRVGRIGIEKSMELMLHGSKGYQLVEVDSVNRIKKVLDVQEAKGGHDIFLTIDRELQIKVQDLLVRQLAHLIQTRLVQRKGGKDQTAPLLKEAYINLTDNNSIDLMAILATSEEDKDKPYQLILNKAISRYKQKRIERITKALTDSDIPANTDLADYLSYYLETLVKDGILSKDYKKTSGYEDYEKNAISFKGLLEFYLKESFIAAEHSYQEVTENYILTRYSDNYTFDKKLFMEMLDKELLSYRDLSMLLIEQKVVEVDEATYNAVKSGRMSGLNFMKKLIAELKLMPAQVALDPCTGAVTVTDVHTGEVLAMVSYPSYDNNRLVNQFDNDYYRSLLNDKAHPLYPTATQGRTAPGSTFKVFSAIAGLEEGVITKNAHLPCTGVFTKLNPNIRCWVGYPGHGSIPLRRAIGVSCNSYFNEVGYRMGTKNGNYDAAAGTEILRKYAAMFGLTTLSGVEVPEAMPIPPGSLDPSTHIANPATAAMGQEQNAYAAVHLARYMNTVGNKGTLHYLTLIHQINEPDGSIYYKQVPKVEVETGIPESTFQAVYEGMRDVNTSGTGRGVFAGFPIEVGGKTGTAQQTKTRADHSVYVALAPMSDPETAVVVVIPFGSTPYIASAGITGSVAKDIYAYYYELERVHGLQPEAVADN
ncbi:hypothetical protein EII17_10190 [Clostridiales bacterium COT073_COT-073]|nr:hypothetical protein EII17_10190 [Clostridiales bacterium COT073_COT-073]